MTRAASPPSSSPEPSSVEGAPAKLGKRALIALAWKKGTLKHLLDAGQAQMYSALKSAPGEMIYCNLPRRRGKTYFLCVVAIEHCLRHPNAEVKYAAGTQKAIKKMVRPSFAKILTDCPAELRPKWHAADGEFVFPNGSRITLSGCDSENFENLRGTEAHLIIIDEAGFIDALKSVVEDVLAPQTLETNGNILVASTPPRSLDHYAVELIEACQRKEKELGVQLYFHQTVWDNPRLSEAKIQGYIRRQARNMPVEEYVKTPSFRREFMAELVTDLDAAVVPEWQEAEKDCVTELPMPTHFDAYTSQDIGYRDGWAQLYAYWDFLRAKLVVMDEMLVFKTTTDIVVKRGLEKEEALWRKKKVYQRVSDNDLLTIADMERLGMSFVPIAKDDKEAQINRIREWVKDRKLIIHPRCKLLIHQLRVTVWNDAHSSFVRNKEGHGDLLDALVYLARGVNQQRNPFPAHSNVVPFGAYRQGGAPGRALTPAGKTLKGALTPRLRRG